MNSRNAPCVISEKLFFMLINIRKPVDYTHFIAYNIK